ncbi:MAG: triose-phosphate isomerase [Spirochaetales bacterium]|nr:triose-phosphate isomerase [Spirochaetales bacterium]
MRISYIAGNWKMHKTVGEAEALARELVRGLDRVNRKVMIAPPFTALAAVKRQLEGSHILLGAQNMGPEEKGAHTGEISVLMLRDVGVDVAILGHSERRHVYGESDALVNQKVRLALAHGLEVVLCVGETLEEREGGLTDQVVESQVTAGLREVSEQELARVTLAYEPVWAIGTGKTATPQDADRTHRVIRGLLGRLYGNSAAEAMVVQYGGSVKPANAADLMAMEHIDGLLVGGASLEAESFLAIVKYEQGR